jgi:hypothetical protein
MELFSTLGFCWNRTTVPAVVPTHSIERVAFRFHRMLPEFVWDASVLEGNPFTFPEVKTLLDGVTVGGRKISDQAQILNLAESSKHLLALVKAGKWISWFVKSVGLAVEQADHRLDAVLFKARCWVQWGEIPPCGCRYRRG